MFFDDRLATVLRQRGDSESGARTQFRQLLDILGNRKYGEDQSLIAAAWLRMDALAAKIPAPERAAMIRETGWRLRSADLAAHLSDFEPEVASAALNRAELSPEDWTALIPRLPVRARGFLRLRRDLPVDAETLLDRLGVHDRGLPSPRERSHGEETLSDESKPQPHDEEPLELDTEFEAPVDADGSDAEGPPPQVETDPQRSEIAALVERIAQFRRDREATPSAPELSPRLPLGEAPRPQDRLVAGFGFAADAAGRIEWAEVDAAAMVIGKRLVARQGFGTPEQRSPLERAFSRRLPIERAPLHLEGAEAIAGDWIVDAQPRFTEGGNFGGYVGRFRRPAPDDPARSAAAREADRIRQLLHELRTPVTAVQGYAEVIQQQLFGPAPHEYRALAAAIAADAAHILAGFEELDRLARLETGASEFAEGETDLGAMVKRMTGQLGHVLGPRQSAIEFAQTGDGPIMVALDPDEVEAMMWRVLATLAGACASGEVIDCRLFSEGALARLQCELPSQLIAEEDVFSAEARPSTTSLNAGLFGAGFSLRLARAEARAAGGGLFHEDGLVSLTLPLLTGSVVLPSQSGGSQSGGDA